MPQRQPRYSKGQRIGGRFLVHQALMGGMGEVYLCLDEQQMIPFALKTFQGSSSDLFDLFKQEVASWVALEKHPNIVRCFWMEKFDNIPFMVLEWVAGDESRGTDLRSWLRRGPLDLPLALRFTIDIVRGLIHANERVPRIVHRDLKPDNVLVNQSRQAKITDFGLATVAQTARLDTTGTDKEDMGQSRYIGNIVGTPAYMPPEQWRGDADIDFRADVYAVGCILYELLTGRFIFEGRTISELRAQHLEAPLPRLSGSVPPAIQRILDGCLAKRREDRFERLNVLVDELIEIYVVQGGKSLPEVGVEKFTASDYINRGVAFRSLRKAQQAIEDYDQALRLDPNNAIAYSNRGNVYGDIGQEQQAIKDYDQALRLDPNNARVYSNRALSLSNLGQYQRAIEDFNQSLRLDPTLGFTYSNRGGIYTKLSQYQRAIEDFNQALHLNPTDVQAYSNRGNNYAAQGQYQQAIEDFDQALHLDPTYIKAYMNRGVTYVAQGQYQRAFEDLDQALRLDPADALAYEIRGNIYGELGQYQSAIKDFDQALRLNPTDKQAYLGRAHGYTELGQYQLAIEDFDQALLLDPTDKQAYLGRSHGYTELGQYQRAIENLNQILVLDPTSAQAYSNRAALYLTLKQYQQAVEESDHALRFDPNDRYAWFNKGAGLASLGRLQEALVCFESSYALGYQPAVGAIRRARHELGLPPMYPQGNSSDPQAAFEAFQRADSLEMMRQAVQQFFILAQMISAIEQVIQQQVPPELKPQFEQRLAWLRQIVEGK